MIVNLQKFTDPFYKYNNSNIKTKKIMIET